MARGKKDKPIFVADCETDPFQKGRIPVPFLWGVYDGNNYEQFEQTSEFIRYITQIDCICYAHNGGKFDWHFITDWIEYGTDLMIINGRLASFKIGECEFRDSWNILPVPLAQMEKTKGDYAIFEATERYKPHNWKIITSYLYDDCRFLFDYVMGFIDRFGLHLTIAGTALKTWEKMTNQKAYNDVGGFLYDQFSEYYYGGRCQAFTTGIITGQCEMIDINSAYPRAMLDGHPYGALYETLTGEQCETMRHDMPGHIFVTVTGEAVGALPYRSDDGGLFFPDDKTVRQFHITGWEWRALHDTGRATSYTIDYGYLFDDVIDFNGFIMPLFEERKICKANADKKGDLLAKTCMNSLYGKFASNPDSYSKFRVTDPERITELKNNREMIDDEWNFGGYFGELALLEKPLPDYEQRYYCLPTSASITGWVRAYLWRAICLCDGVLYCDTDSIIARDVSKMMISKELGEWSHDATFNGGGIGGKKLYAFEGVDGKWKTAAKGARLDHTEIMAICRGESVLFEPMAPTFSVHKKPTFNNRTLKTSNKVLTENKPKIIKKPLAKPIKIF